MATTAGDSPSDDAGLKGSSAVEGGSPLESLLPLCQPPAPAPPAAGATPSSHNGGSTCGNATSPAMGAAADRASSAGRIRTDSHSLRHGERESSSGFSRLHTSNSFCSMLQYGVSSEQGARKTMEDQHKALVGLEPITPRDGDGSGARAPPAGIPFFAVYDGHGGTQCAEYLREHLHRLVLLHPLLRLDPEAAVKLAIAEAETGFMEKCRLEKIESGSTVAVAFVIDERLVTANVGDSEIVLCRAGGVAELLTTKHHLSCNASEVERVRAAGGRIFHSRVGHPKFNPQLVSLAVTRAIGDAGFKLDEYTDGKASGIIADADTKTTQVVPSDRFFIIGCDGLWDVMTYDDAVKYCNQLLDAGATSTEISQSIVQEALRLGSTDNVTVMFVLLPGSALQRASSAGVLGSSGGSSVLTPLADGSQPAQPSPSSPLPPPAASTIASPSLIPAPLAEPVSPARPAGLPE